jgi:hypothetical protein
MTLSVGEYETCQVKMRQVIIPNERTLLIYIGNPGYRLIKVGQSLSVIFFQK